MREFLKGLDLDSELLDTIMAEHGKIVTKDKEELQTLKAEISSLKENSKDMADWKTKFEELDSKIKEQEAKKKAEEEDSILTNNILETIKDKKFINDYTKDAIVNEVKSALKDKNNAGKSAKDLFENITKNKKGIFQNDNQFVDMADMKDTDTDTKAKSEGIKLNPMFKTYN